MRRPSPENAWPPLAKGPKTQQSFFHAVACSSAPVRDDVLPCASVPRDGPCSVIVLPATACSRAAAACSSTALAAVSVEKRTPCRACQSPAETEKGR